MINVLSVIATFGLIVANQKNSIERKRFLIIDPGLFGNRMRHICVQLVKL